MHGSAVDHVFLHFYLQFKFRRFFSSVFFFLVRLFSIVIHGIDIPDDTVAGLLSSVASSACSALGDTRAE